MTSSYQPIIDSLYQKCTVQLNKVVKEINTRENYIEVLTETASYYSDAVIVTVPLGVLKNNDIKFNPPLPPCKQASIKRLEMGLFNITALKFSKSFWPKEPHAWFFNQFDTSSIPLFFNLNHFISQPILVRFSGGKRALCLGKYSDEELIQKTICNLRKVFGSNLPEPESFLNTRWSQDKYSYGSYSYVPTGASGEDYEALAQPASNRLYFAGEATNSIYPATTHGTYLSGIREAERIKNTLG